MQAEYMRRCGLCLLKEEEVAFFVQNLRKSHPDVEIALFPSPGEMQLMFQSDRPVDALVELTKQQFPTFFYGEGRIEEAMAKAFIERGKTLSFAESCTGGAMAAKVTAIPGASGYFLGSFVTYCNAWKERFLHVSRSTLETKGAVSRETVIEMVRGLLQETDADYCAAISGIAGPSGGSKQVPVGTICIAIGVRGDRIDAGIIHAPQGRSTAIDLAVHLTLGALWRRLVHQTATFS